MYTVSLLIFYLFYKVNGIDESHYLQSIEDVIAPLSKPGELGEYFEGDMILTEDQMRALNSSDFAKNGLREVYYRWPYNTVTYFFAENEFYSVEKRLIRNAMEDIETNSCVKFRERTKEEYAVRITKAGRGCFSGVGYQYYQLYEQNEQVLNLGQGCYQHGIIVHEMLHTIGFYHMQSTYNRDDYVDIIWQNIEKGMEHNFYEYNSSTVTDFGVAYDYNSVMHYGSRYFSKNGRRTIIPTQECVTIGQRIGMSQRDIQKLNLMYNCYNGNEENISNNTTTPSVATT